MIVVENHGPLIITSNYWGSDLEAAGKFFVSVNAGAIRVLVPRTARAMIEESRSSKHVILSRGPWPEQRFAEAVEILFEDGTTSPFALHLALESFDNLPGEPPAGREWVLTLWDWKKTKPHKALERVCHWRRVARIPWLRPWGEA